MPGRGARQGVPVPEIQPRLAQLYGGATIKGGGTREQLARDGHLDEHKRTASEFKK